MRVLLLVGVLSTATLSSAQTYRPEAAGTSIVNKSQIPRSTQDFSAELKCGFALDSLGVSSGGPFHRLNKNQIEIGNLKRDDQHGIYIFSAAGAKFYPIPQKNPVGKHCFDFADSATQERARVCQTYNANIGDFPLEAIEKKNLGNFNPTQGSEDANDHIAQRGLIDAYANAIKIIPGEIDQMAKRADPGTFSRGVPSRYNIATLFQSVICRCKKIVDLGPILDEIRSHPKVKPFNSMSEECPKEDNLISWQPEPTAPI